MKARKRDSNDDWRNIAYVQLEDSYCLTSADQMEFQQDALSTELKTYNQLDEDKHWQDVRERVAIVAMQTILRNTDNKVPLSSFNIISKNAVILADELVKQLKGE